MGGLPWSTAATGECIGKDKTTTTTIYDGPGFIYPRSSCFSTPETCRYKTMTVLDALYRPKSLSSLPCQPSIMSSETKVWFSECLIIGRTILRSPNSVTGCSSGFGLCITDYALQKGDKVVATLRKPEVLSELAAKYPESLLVLRLDVTKTAEVTAAFTASREKFGRVDMVVNNAGFGVVAEVEGTADNTARGVFEVNFWGASHVSREAVRFFREENKPRGGRLLQVSSLSGVHSSAGAVYYCAR